MAQKLRRFLRSVYLPNALVIPPMNNKPNAAGFTLLEVMVSVSVLILLVVLVSKMTEGVSRTISENNKHMDADAQARLIFDRMANDFSAIILRDDVDCAFIKQTPGNDSLFFFSESPASFDPTAQACVKSSVALVGYKIDSKLRLERLGMGLSWDGGPNESVQPTIPGSMVHLTYPSLPLGTVSAVQQASLTPTSASTITGNWPVTVASDAATNTNYQVIGDQVYRMEISFLLTNGILSNNPFITDPGNSRFNFHEVSAIVVALAILDTNSRKVVLNTGQMVNALRDSVEGTSALESWNNSNYLSASSIPNSAVSQIRFYQRYFYLNHK